MTGPSRALAIALVSAILLGFDVGPAGAATPAAVFLTPAPGVVSVVRTGSFQVTWAIAPGVQIAATTLAVQTSRPVGVAGCDPRWAPAGVQSVSGTSFDVQDLALDRCYRFVLLMDTDGGSYSVTSAPVIPASGGWGPVAGFANPFADGVVSYLTSVHIVWWEYDTFDSPMLWRSLIEQSAPANGESCSGVSWPAGAAVSVTGSAVLRTLEPSRCYRYVLTLQDAAGFQIVVVSGALRIAAGLPAWSGTLNLHRDAAFVSQVTITQCVAAASQMMLNLILDRNDTSSGSQTEYMTYAEANDGVTYPGGGSNPAGWTAVMNGYGGLPYSVGRYIDSGSAIRAAATRLRLTNRPVGLLVFRGRHAWVMSGFEATADPAVTSTFTVTAVYISGPLYPRLPNPSGYDPPPNTRLTTSQLTSQYFLRYYDSSLTTWNSYWVTIQP